MSPLFTPFTRTRNPEPGTQNPEQHHAARPGGGVAHRLAYRRCHNLFDGHRAASGRGRPLQRDVAARAGRGDTILYDGKDDQRRDERHAENRARPGHESIIRPTLRTTGVALAMRNTTSTPRIPQEESQPMNIRDVMTPN